MSLILDALNRSRREQDAGDVPTVDSVHYATASQGVSPLWWLVGALTLALVITLLILLWPSEDKTDTLDLNAGNADSPATGAAQSDLNAFEQPAKPSGNAVARQSAQPNTINDAASAEANGSEVAALYDERREEVTLTTTQPERVTEASSSVGQKTPAAGVGASEEQSTGLITAQTARENDKTSNAEGSVSAADAASDGKTQSERSASKTEETPIDVEEVLRRAQRQFGEPLLEPHPVPLLGTLSQQAKDRIPTLIYSAHNFASDGNSTVTLNNKELKVGQRTDGFTVKEILQDSVVLSWGGTEFRLRALNSWINL
jgi:general secretion pathway protein B